MKMMTQRDKERRTRIQELESRDRIFSKIERTLPYRAAYLIAKPILDAKRKKSS